MVTSLAECQTLFWRCVRYDPAPAELESVFVGTRSLDARASMGVYRSMYWHRQIDALFDIFPRLVEAMGRADFTKMACAYLTAHPSRHAELERIGTSLPGYLAAQRSCWADVATLEAASVEVLIAPPARRVAGIHEIDPADFESRQLELAPAHVQVRVARDSFDRVERREPRQPAPTWVLVQRVGRAVVRRELADDEATALALAQAGARAGAICAAFADPVRAHAVLSQWFRAGLVVALTASSTELSS